MRFIVKPAGALLILGAIIALTALCYRSYYKYQTLTSFQEGSSANGESLVTGDLSRKDLVRSPNAGELVSPDMQRWNMIAFLPARARRKFVTFENPPWQGSAHGIQITVAAINPPAGAKCVELVKAIPADVPAGATIKIDFWARSDSQTPIEVSLTESDSLTEELKETIALTPAWKQYHFTVPTKQSHAPGKLAFMYRLGLATGQVEFAQVNLARQ